MSRRAIASYLVPLTTLCGLCAYAQSPTAAVGRLGRPTIRTTDVSASNAQIAPVLLPAVTRADVMPSGPVITIHCGSSIGHGAVFVVDGVVLGIKADSTIDESVAQRFLERFTPDDIASIEVVKGPSAVALYGPGAHNGAIIIATKTKRRYRP